MMKDLKKLMRQDQQFEEQQSESKEMISLKSRLHRKPFWLYYPQNHGHDNNTDNNCCFVHILNLFKKPGSDKLYPVFDYEIQILRALEEPEYINFRQPTEEERQQYEKKIVDSERELVKEKTGSIRATRERLRREKTAELIYPEKVGHCLVLKSSGLGLTSFFLAYIAWLCLKDDKLKGQDIVIISGPREQLSIDLITRLRQMFLHFNITFDTRESTLFLNTVRIRSFPSNNLSAVRGLESVALVFLDEAAFFGPDSQSEVLDVVERYAGKNSARIILTSTPNRPGDLIHTILNSDKKNFYKVLKFDYTWGLGKIYEPQDIMIAKRSDSFEREFNLSFVSPEGNCFSNSGITRAIELGKKYPDVINKAAQHSLGLDPGFGSSAFGVVCLEYSDSIIKVVFAEQYEKSSFDSMLQKVFEIKTMVGELSNIYIDMANTEYIEAVKQELGENSNWQYIHERIAYYKKNRLNISEYMKTVPVSFALEGVKMLVHCKNLLENEDSLVAINPRHEKLIAGLRGAIAKEYRLNKTETPYSDLVDAYRLAMKFFSLEK
jgi:hypothetical protein